MHVTYTETLHCSEHRLLALVAHTTRTRRMGVCTAVSHDTNRYGLVSFHTLSERRVTRPAIALEKVVRGGQDAGLGGVRARKRGPGTAYIPSCQWPDRTLFWERFPDLGLPFWGLCLPCSSCHYSSTLEVEINPESQFDSSDNTSISVKGESHAQ